MSTKKDLKVKKKADIFVFLYICFSFQKVMISFAPYIFGICQ